MYINTMFLNNKEDFALHLRYFSHYTNNVESKLFIDSIHKYPLTIYISEHYTPEINLEEKYQQNLYYTKKFNELSRQLQYYEGK